MQKVKETYSKEMTQAANNSFNLASSAMLIAAHDMGMNKEDVKELLARCFGILDDVADNLSTIDSMMTLVSSWGIEIYRTAEEKTSANADTIFKKTAVFDCLGNGIEEIGQILDRCKAHNIQIDYRDACRFRWEYDREKYYESIEKEIDMSKKEQVFEKIEQGADKQSLIDEFGISGATADQYRYLYRKEKGDIMANKNKVKAFNLIDRGAGIKELMKELVITEAAATRYFEAYREEKSEGEIEVMTENMKKAFELFDKAYSVAQVVDVLKLGKATIENYKAEWVRTNKRDLSTDEMSEILSGADESIVILRHKGVLPKEEKKDGAKTTAKKHFEANQARKDDESVAEKEESKPEEKGEKPAQVNGQVSSKQVEAREQHAGYKYEYREMPNGLKKKVKVVEVAEAIEGEFAIYTPVTSNVFDMEIDGQVITINREQMAVLSRELLAVAEEEI